MRKFKIDENLPTDVAQLIANAGHEASTVYDQRLGGVSDQTILSICQDEKRGFLTLDLDFADIRAFPPARFSGLVVFRLARQDKQHVLTAVERWLSHFDETSFPGTLWIVDETSIRVRT